MATKKPAPKKASKVAKPAAKKAVAVKPAAKAKAPAKPAAKPTAKKAAPAKKPVAAKPVAKKPTPAPKPVAKPAPKAVAKKATPAPKPVAKAAPKAAAKPAAKPTPAPAAKTVAPKSPEKPVQQNNMKPKENKATPPKPVVIPKTTTKTVRKYQPEFTKSILDKPKQENTGTLVRYSDSDLAEFKELIQRKLDTAKKELTYLQGLITRKDEMGGDESDNRYMTMEDGSLSMEREQLSQMASRQITFIDHLEKALMRIENKTYGVCRVTGKLIDKARLRAVPHATLSIEAKMGIVK